MIQFVIIGFFVCLGVKAAIDIYDGIKKVLLSDEVKESFKEGAEKLHEKVDSSLGIHTEEHKKQPGNQSPG